MSNIEKSVKKSGLGRGLGSLLGGDLDDLKVEPSLRHHSAKKEAQPEMAAIPKDARIWKIALEKIQPNPTQPRKSFDKEKLRELAQSIKEHGLLQPIAVRSHKDGLFEIIAGERRWRGAQLAGLTEVPALIKEVDDQKSLELALIENIQRAHLNPIEEAEAYQRLTDMYDLTQQTIADRVGKDRVTVTNLIRLLGLDPQVRAMVASEDLSMGHAKVLLSVTDLKTQRKLAGQAAKDKLSVRKLEKLIKNASSSTQETKLNPEESLRVDVSKKLVEGMSEELQKKLGTKVTIDYNNSKGKISVHFYSDDELTHLVERFKS